jgi:type I restriction enzyme S subunit
VKTRNLVPLGDFIEQIRGVSYKPSEIRTKSEEDYLPILRASNFDEEGLNTKGLIYIHKSRINENQLIKAGDILIASSSGSKEVVGKSIQFKEDFHGSFGAFCKLIRVKQGFATGYVGHFFKSKVYKNAIRKSVQGANINNLRNEHIDSLQIPRPSIADQIRIDNILSRAELLIHQRKESLRLLDEFLKSTFLEMFGDPVRNEKGWAKASLGEVVEIRGRVGWKGYKKTDLRTSGPYVLGATHLTNNGEIDLSHPVFISREKYEESPEIVIKKNDLLLVQRGNTIGKIGLVTDDLGEATINPCILILRPRKIRPRFLKQYLLNEKVITQLRGMNNASAQPMLTQSDLRDFKICLPHTDLQTQFSSIMEKTEVLSLHYDNSLQQLAQLYSSVCQRAFAGKLSLKQKTTAKVKSKPQT